jgi:hypothetical protein
MRNELAKNPVAISAAISSEYGSAAVAVSEGLGNPLRKITRPPAIAAAGGIGDGSGFVYIEDDRAWRRYLVAGEVAKIARAGGARHNIPADVMRRSVDLVMSYFSYLGPSEISAAFDLALSGKTAVNLSMYGGQFNAVYLSEILRAYKKHRAEIRRKIEKERDALAAEAKREAVRYELKKAARTKTAEALGDYLDAIRRGEDPPRRLMSYQYDQFEAEISASAEEKREAMAAARSEVVSYLQNEKAETLDGFARLDITRTIEALRPGDGRIVAAAKIRILADWLQSKADQGVRREAFILSLGC